MAWKFTPARKKNIIKARLWHSRYVEAGKKALNK
jgi:hypothetical protein